MSAYAQISGRLGQDPELRSTKGGQPVINLSIASHRQKKNEEGEKINLPDWFRITVYGREAEVIAQYAKKGSALSFNGRLQTESYTDREGQERMSVYLVADSFEFLPLPKRTEENREPNTAAAAKGSQTARPGWKKSRVAKAGTQDDDIPF
jgi:single-strand DNA-binding protein